MPVFDFSASDRPVAQKIENNNRIQEHDDDLTDYNGSGDEDENNSEISEDLENIIFWGEYYNCYICKKECQIDEDYYLLDWDNENKILISAICYDCKKKEIEKECISCGKEFENNENYIKEVKYLLDNYGKIEECISCMVINNKLNFNPIEIEDLKIEENINPKDNKNFDNKYNITEVYSNYDDIEQIEHNIKEDIINKDNILKNLDENELYNEMHNRYSHDNFGEEEKNILNSIYNTYQISENDEICINSYLSFSKNILDTIGIDYDYISIKNNNDVYVLYNNDKKYIHISENIKFIDKINPQNQKCLNILEKSIEFIGNKNNLNKYKIDYIILKKDFLSYKINKKKLKKEIKIILDEFNDAKNKNDEIINKINVLDKELDELIQIEKILPIYNKLKENNSLDLIDEGANDLQKLFKKLNNDKINEYNTMKSIGEKIIKDNLDNNQIKELLGDYKNDRLNRIVTKCKRINILSKYVDISNIAVSGISHFLRDTKEDIFNMLLNLFKEPQYIKFFNNLIDNLNDLLNVI